MGSAPFARSASNVKVRFQFHLKVVHSSSNFPSGMVSGKATLKGHPPMQVGSQEQLEQARSLANGSHDIQRW